MSNKISKNKLNFKITPKLLLLIFMAGIVLVQIAVIAYCNLVELQHHLGFDASSAYLQAVEVWRSKSLIPSTFALTTTLGLDSPVPLAALLYGLTNNIFLAFGLTNLFFDIIIVFIFYLILREFNCSAFQILLGMIFLLCPFMTPDHFTDNNLSYFAMVLGEQGSYSIKIITMLLLLLSVIKLEHKKKGYITVIMGVIFNIITSLSSGIYVAITILVPCILYYIIKIIYKNSFKTFFDNFAFILVILQLIISFACKSLAGHFFSFQSKEAGMVLTGIYDFWHNLGSIIMGYLQLFCGISIETTVGLFSLRGILQLLSICFIFFMFILFIISIKHSVRAIKHHVDDFTFILPYTVIFTNIAIFIFSYTLYDGYFFEYRYLIIVYLMQILICCTTINKLSESLIFKNLITFGIAAVLLVETVGIFRFYHINRVDEDVLNPLIDTVDSLDTPIAYIWGSTSPTMQIEARDLRVMDLSVIYRTLTDETYKRSNRWGDYLYLEENSLWTGRTALITTDIDLYELPEFIYNKYKYVDSFGEYILLVSEENPFDLTAFDNNCSENVNFMYSDMVDINGLTLDQNGNLTTDINYSGNIMTMTLPDVNPGTYSIKLDYESNNDFETNSDTYIAIYNESTLSPITESAIYSDNNYIEIDNIILNDISNIIIKCNQAYDVSLTLKKITINKQ